MGINTIMRAAGVLSPLAAAKMLEKFDPKFKNYFTKATAYGFTIDNAMDYLNERYQSEEPFRQQLEKGAKASQLRPDEQISKNALETAEMPGKIAKSAAAIGGGALLGGIAGAAASTAESLSQKNPEQMQQKQPGPREQALKRHSEMNKRKKLIDQLTEDFENEYGQGNVSATRFPGASEGASPNERIQQATPGQSQNLERLIQLLQQRKQRGL
jgi:hypothetical protein